MRVIFLTLEEVLALHADQIDRYGGSLGVRDVGLLQSALAVPEATFGGALLHPSLPEVAAAHLFHLVRDHPFVDGNKRVGLAAMLLFLRLNSLWLRANANELFELTLGGAEGRISKAEVAVFVQRHARARRPGGRP